MSNEDSSRRHFMKTTAVAAAAVSAQSSSAAQSPGGVESGGMRAGQWPASRPLGKKVLWNELARSEFPALLENDPVVILPIGSLEQHGPHCPVDMDISIPYHLAAATAEGIDDFPVVVGPPVWTGFTHYNMGGYGTITVRLETFIAVVSDICRSIKANGFDRIIMVNGHGGNVAPVTAIANKLAQEDIMTLSLPYWNLVDQEMKDWSTADLRGPGHGGEWETSFQMYLRPHLVHMDRREAGQVRWPYSPAVRKYAHVPERRRESANGSMGDPFSASAEKGERIFGLAVERLTAIVKEFHATPLMHYEEFGSDTKVLPSLF
ncbi:MAG: creatininase family protein [Acidobacteria bacterium]|nr:creatininase family protein [Acidobacteriota bacterium]